MKTIKTAQHTAAWDPLTGAGVLALPPLGDCHLELGMSNLAEVDYRHMIQLLNAQHVGVLKDEDGMTWLELGRTASGGLAIALDYRDAIDEGPDPSAYGDALSELSDALGVALFTH